MSRAALLTVFATGALVAPALSVAKGKPPTTGEGCKPAVTVVMKGTAAADGTTSLSLTPTGGNHWARLLLGNGAVTQTTVTPTGATKVQVGGKAGALSSIKKGDRVLVQYRACKADLLGTKGANASTLTNTVNSLKPRKVIDLGTGSDNEKEDEDNDKD